MRVVNPLVEERPRFRILQQYRCRCDQLANLNVFARGLVEAPIRRGDIDAPQAQDKVFQHRASDAALCPTGVNIGVLKRGELLRQLSQLGADGVRDEGSDCGITIRYGGA